MHRYNKTLIHVLLRCSFEGYSFGVTGGISLPVAARYACLVIPIASIFKLFMSKKKPA